MLMVQAASGNGMSNVTVLQWKVILLHLVVFSARDKQLGGYQHGSALVFWEFREATGPLIRFLTKHPLLLFQRIGYSEERPGAT